MSVYAEHLRSTFPNLDPVVDDLFLLEAHQIGDLPERAPRSELGVLLRARPDLARFLVTRHPPIKPFLSELLALGGAASVDLDEAADVVLWEIADFIVYQRAPDLYDDAVSSDWTREALAEAEPLGGKVVLDAGSGTGQVALKVAEMAAIVLAVEPVGTLRTYIRQRAEAQGISNLFVLSGTLAAIPVPGDSVDVLLTQRAIGWDLEAELAEIRRVVKLGGAAIHLSGTPEESAESIPHRGGLLAGGYRESLYEENRTRLVKHVAVF